MYNNNKLIKFAQYNKIFTISYLLFLLKKKQKLFVKLSSRKSLYYLITRNNNYSDKLNLLNYKKYNKNLKSDLNKFNLSSFKKLKNVEWIDEKNFNKMMELKRVNKGFFILKMKQSNYFIVLTDLNKQPLIVCSLGQATNEKNKKKKLNFMLVIPLMKKIIQVLNALNIQTVSFFFKTKINNYTYNVFSSLLKANINIDYLYFFRPIPHHYGQRKKKQRRI